MSIFDYKDLPQNNISMSLGKNLYDSIKPILKYDNDKPRLGLVPPTAIQAIGEIMTYGLSKYEESSWKRVEAWRYRDALMRHLCEYLIDPYGMDKESGKPHLWHVITNAAFLCEIEAHYLRGNMIVTIDNPDEHIKIDPKLVGTR